MNELVKGVTVISKAGHDCGKRYIVVGVDNEYVFLSDGKSRPMHRPKKKKKKHVQPVYKNIMKLKLSDDNIKKWLKKEEELYEEG